MHSFAQYFILLYTETCTTSDVYVINVQYFCTNLRYMYDRLLTYVMSFTHIISKHYVVISIVFVMQWRFLLS